MQVFCCTFPSYTFCFNVIRMTVRIHNNHMESYVLREPNNTQLQKAGGGASKSLYQDRDAVAAANTTDEDDLSGGDGGTGKYKNLAAVGGKDDSIILNNRWFNKTTGLYVDCNSPREISYRVFYLNCWERVYKIECFYYYIFNLLYSVTPF